jgi:hypothetical protein
VTVAEIEQQVNEACERLAQEVKEKNEYLKTLD